MSDDFLLYPTAAIAMDNGDLVQVTNFKLTVKRTNKVIHTLRQIAAGKFHGTVEGDVSCDSVVPETGLERDYITMVIKGRIKKLRVKIPGQTWSVSGSVDEATIESTLEDAIKNGITFSGRVTI